MPPCPCEILIMRKYILSPICSAFVVPGIGQVLNQNLVKGVVILGMVFILIISSTIHIALTLRSVFQKMPPGPSSPEKILEMFLQQDLHVLWYFIIAFAAIWVYSVADALWVGIKMEKQKGGDSP